MQINTRFDIDDVVWQAQRIPVQVWHKCTFCAGKGTVMGVDGTSQECPKCRGRCGTSSYLDADPWCVSEPLKVASVTARHYAKNVDRPYEESYMMYNTGCPSGGVYELGTVQLFASEQAAMDYADRENDGLAEPEGVVVCECGGQSKCSKCHGYGRYEEASDNAN